MNSKTAADRRAVLLFLQAEAVLNTDHSCSRQGLPLSTRRPPPGPCPASAPGTLQPFHPLFQNGMLFPLRPPCPYEDGKNNIQIHGFAGVPLPYFRVSAVMRSMSGSRKVSSTYVVTVTKIGVQPLGAEEGAVPAQRLKYWASFTASFVGPPGGSGKRTSGQSSLVVLQKGAVGEAS